MYEYEFYFPPRLTLDEVNELLDIIGGEDERFN